MAEDNIKDFELEAVAARLNKEGHDFQKVVMPNHSTEAWRIVDMIQHPTESVFCEGHGFYESVAIHIKQALDRAYERGGRLYIKLDTTPEEGGA